MDAIQLDPFHSPWTLKAAAALSARAESEPPSADAQPEEAPAAPMPLETDDFRSAVDAYERALLEEALSANRFNQRATAAAIGLSYDQLRHALKRHKLLDAGSRQA